MTFQEIITRLKAEGIAPQQFSNEYFASLSTLRASATHEDLAWLGQVDLATRQVGGDELTLTYHLPLHDVYFQTTGLCRWEPQEKDFSAASDDYQEALIAWYEKHPNQSFVWDFIDHYSPVKPVTKTVVEYHYAPELLAV